MNRQQIARIYDEFPESQQDISREQFINGVLNALDPNRMVAEANKIVQRRCTGSMNKNAIDSAMRRK